MVARQLVSRSPFSAGMQFLVLIFVVIITGLSQGLLLPLLSTLLEEQGVSSGTNGLNAAALYIGIFVTMFVIEKPVRRWGFQRVILVGMVVVMCATLMFPLWMNLSAWFVLRFLVGMGDSALHYGTQLWIVSKSPADKRGRNISLYGMSYAVGFSIGPMGINLISYSLWLPFLIVAALCAIAIVLLLALPNDYPETDEKQQKARSRYAVVYRMAWFALLTSFLFGYMEATMNSNFPVYGLRSGISTEWVTVLLPAIGIGSLVLQLPLGMLSDKIGRKPILLFAALFGSIAFLAVPLAGANSWALLVLLGIAGGLVGSFYSLGLAYAADLLPRPLLPAANVIASIQYSIGSIVGPSFGGLGIQYISLASMFYLLGGFFLLFAVLGFWVNRTGLKTEYECS